MVAIYTQNFVEEWEKVAEITLASISAETNLAARVDISAYTRLAIQISTEGAETLDVDFEQADALTGGTLKTIDANSHDVTVAATAGTKVVEIRTEEFDTNPGIESIETFKWFNVEITPAGANVTGVIVLGLPKNQPAVNNWL